MGEVHLEAWEEDMVHLIQNETDLKASQAQVDRFWEDGFLVQDGILSMEEVEELRSICERPELNEGLENATVHFKAITAMHPAFLNLARDPRIINIVRALIGEDIQLQHSKLAAQSTTKGKGGFGWHQDFVFFPHTNTDLVAVMILLDDATPENGCMSMVRGSHRLGQLDHRVNGEFVNFCQEKKYWEDHPDQVIPVTPKAGGISIHHCLTLHGSGANSSGCPRRGIVFQYRADDAYQMVSNIFPDTGLVVSGQHRGKVRCDVGTVWLPIRANWRETGNPFGAAWNQQGEFAAKTNAEY
jgi:hypothetical protein